MLSRIGGLVVRCVVPQHYCHQLPLVTTVLGGRMGKNKASKETSTKGKSNTKATESSAEKVCNPISCNKSDNVLIKILAKPGAKENGITNMCEDGVGVQIAAPPTEGEANAELIKYLASVLGLRKSDVSLERGSRSRQKSVAVRGLTVAQVEEKLKNVIK